MGPPCLPRLRPGDLVIRIAAVLVASLALIAPGCLSSAEAEMERAAEMMQRGIERFKQTGDAAEIVEAVRSCDGGTSMAVDDTLLRWALREPVRYVAVLEALPPPEAECIACVLSWWAADCGRRDDLAEAMQGIIGPGAARQRDALERLGACPASACQRTR